jgi:hypothetical protein
MCPVEGRPLYLDLDLLADLCLLGFRGTTARDSITSLEGFMARLFCFGFAGGFVVLTSRMFFSEVGNLTVRFLALVGVFFRDSNVPFMPACAIDTALLTSSMRFLIPIAHHARIAQHSLVLTIHTLLVTVPPISI